MANSADSAARRAMAVLSAWNLVVFIAWVLVPFVLAGVAWVAGWLYLGVVLAGALAEDRHVSRSNPGLKARRKRIGGGTKPWDLGWNALFWPLMASIEIAGALQFRHQGHAVGAWGWAAGVAVVAAGFFLSAWAMGANPFFESTVRLQVEVGHRVFEGGPYRFVRHPGYAGLMLWALGTPLIVRSTWSFAPALATAAWLALRTALEDATLRRELPGYADYASRTKHRLLPGLW